MIPVPSYPTFAKPAEVGLSALKGACREQLSALGILVPSVDHLAAHDDTWLLLTEVRGAQCAFRRVGADAWERLATEAERHLVVLCDRLRAQGRRAS